jgi:PAT family beta-lactamase induction signal transducer AmpG
VAYGVMAASMLVGMVTVLLSPAAARAGTAQPGRMAAGRWWPRLPTSCAATAGRRSDPGADRHLPHQRRGDGHHGQPFYVDMGYTKDEVAAVTKVFGVIMTLLGAFMGG